MQAVLNVEDVQKVEQDLTLEGVSLAELMRRAGHAAAQEVVNLGGVSRVAVLCGTGNNGGDGWVAAELLRRANAEVTVVCPSDPTTLKSPLALMAAKSAVQAGVGYRIAPTTDELSQIFLAVDAVVDAMLGTGFHGAPKTPFNLWIDALNQASKRVVAVDVPSGLSAQLGEAPGSAVVADVTVAMICLKPGLLSDRGRDLCGTIVVAPLAAQAEHLVVEADPVAWRLERTDYFDCLQSGAQDVDKYTRGSVLVAAGSVPYVGAAILCATAAARAGAGYVTLAVPSSIATICRTHLCEIPVIGLSSTSHGTFAAGAKAELLRLAQARSAVVFGPGIQVNADTETLVTALLESDCPLVLDADALNCLSHMTGGHLERFPEMIRRAHPLVMTPHRKELGRLVGWGNTPPATLPEAMDAARAIVWADGGTELTVVAKGASSVCVGVDCALVPMPGPPALATAGSGDVLAGVMGALLATGGRPTASLPLLCAFGCEVHGFAGRLAAEKHGSRGVMAKDVADELGLALDAMEERVLLGTAEAS